MSWAIGKSLARGLEMEKRKKGEGGKPCSGPWVCRRQTRTKEKEVVDWAQVWVGGKLTRTGLQSSSHFFLTQV